MRVVHVFLDSNVLIGALLRPEGPPGRALRGLYDGRFRLVTSTAQLAELRRALTYPRVRKRLRLSTDALDAWLQGLQDLADVMEDVPAIEPTSRDPVDDTHLAAAAAGRADLFVTGDRDLLELAEFEHIRIVKPAAFLALLDQPSSG